jgi:dTDP-4-dehydrorhamnose reductase
MLKIIILGSSGLIGSTLYKYLSQKKNIHVTGTYCSNKPSFKNLLKYNFFEHDLSFLKNYDLIINCIGITKHNFNISNTSLVYNINIKLPLQLDDSVKTRRFKVIHISSDCIFSGSKGNYKENDTDYASDIYGQTKRISEIIMKNSLIIRTSTIGHEFFYKNGLLEWFLSNKKECKGFNNAYFNGLTTLELSKIIYKYFIQKSFYPKSIINIGSNEISKYDLLCKIAQIYNLKIDIKRDFDFKINRTLNINKFIKLTDYKPKTWYKMLQDNKYYIKNV